MKKRNFEDRKSLKKEVLSENKNLNFEEKKKIEEELNNKHFRVSIFGSARVDKKDLQYKQIKQLARMLGERGVDIVTGGGPGLMEAASEGHEEGRKNDGVHSIGLGIKLPKEQNFNQHLDLKKEFHTFTNRLDNFMLFSNAVVVAPGGIGTVLELFYTWQLSQVHHICNIPIILLGKQWPPLIKWMENYLLKNKFISKEDLHLIFLAEDCDEAIKVIDKVHEEFSQGNEDFCLNYKKYRLP